MSEMTYHLDLEIVALTRDELIHKLSKAFIGVAQGCNESCGHDSEYQHILRWSCYGHQNGEKIALPIGTVK